MRQSTNRRGVAEPQVWFRIVHVAADGHHRALDGAYREQTVEIALGPKGAFKNGSVGAVTRRVPANRIVRATSAPRSKSKPTRGPKTPRVVELLQTAMEWRRQLDAGEIETQAAIARREGITRARVTQIMAMLRLVPEIREHILNMPDVVGRSAVGERALRSVVRLDDPADQRARFDLLVESAA
jgi:hypothetical protein